MQSAVAEKTEKHCVHERKRASAQYFSVFSATADRILAPFRDSGPIQHPSTPPRAENIPRREAELAISNAALLSSNVSASQ